MRSVIRIFILSILTCGCLPAATETSSLLINRSEYADQLHGFWLGQCIANWTGLVTEMDKVGDTGEHKTLPFYTREDWGQPDLPSIWATEPSDLSPTIDFVFRGEDEIWGADDDTDIEYMYQHLLLVNETCILTPEQIREGWLKHIKSEEENFLWVSNERAYRLMEEGVLPPDTSDPERNEEFEMIDAQLTTEIFGLFAPGRPDVALKMARLPIRTTARKDAAWISEFYVTMYALAASRKECTSVRDHLFWSADVARKKLPENSYAASMYDFVKAQYDSGAEWETARDALHEKYQVRHEDGYDMSGKYGNGCFAAGINFAASLVSLFYGEGDLKETIKIGSLAGWDSDNPTATWGGLIGFLIGKEGVEAAFGRTFSDRYDIHRTRRNFSEAIDTFPAMARKGLKVIDRVVVEELRGEVDLQNDCWHIPSTGTAARTWPGERSTYHSFAQYHFQLDDLDCRVVVPGKAAPGNPWIWRARFFEHEPQVDLALLEKGFHVVYVDVAGLYGSPQAVERWDRFYSYLTQVHGFDDKAVLEGLSRGGLIIYNWAASNPEKVHCIYADAPVCDFKSWPGIKNVILEAYGLTEAEAWEYKGNPVDNLKPLADAGVPLLHVVGDADKVVPVGENTAIMESRYKALGGHIEVIHKEGVGHHPHSLEDPAPIVAFILKHSWQK
jgi:pimeloyl-ACP methyl ester carboxylesterase